MSIVLPLAKFFNVEDLSREVVTDFINTVSVNIKLVRKISQALSSPFKSSTLTPRKGKK
jgi:hypothetical protein